MTPEAETFSDAELSELMKTTRRQLGDQLAACRPGTPGAGSPPSQVTSAALAPTAPTPRVSPSALATGEHPTVPVPGVPPVAPATGESPATTSVSVSSAGPAAGTTGITGTAGVADTAPVSRRVPPPMSTTAERRVAIGADHGGFELKCRLIELLGELGYEPLDLGTHSGEAVDYPDYAVKVARAVARGEAWRGVMIDGAGIGSAMAANKIPRVRAATCHNEATVINSREHNDANVLVLGSGQVNRGLARRLLRIWLQTPFAGGRHQRRVDKIGALDRQGSLPG